MNKIINKEEVRILIQDMGISAIYPIKKIEDKIIIYSVTDEQKKFNKKFNYIILFKRKEFPFNGTKDEILNQIIQKDFHLISQKDHELALVFRLSNEILNETKNLAKKYI